MNTNQSNFIEIARKNKFAKKNRNRTNQISNIQFAHSQSIFIELELCWPERTGDPSPRCFACAARMMHERALANVKTRSDIPADKEYMSEDNIKSARQLIINSLGLPAKTRVFEYELVGEPNHA